MRITVYYIKPKLNDGVHEKTYVTSDEYANHYERTMLDVLGLMTHNDVRATRVQVNGSFYTIHEFYNLFF